MIAGITSTVTVEWLGPPGSDISADANYIRKSGTYQRSDNTQRATLEVRRAAVTEDKTYTCKVTSNKFSESPSSKTDVKINVYGKLLISFISSKTYLTITHFSSGLLD